MRRVIRSCRCERSRIRKRLFKVAGKIKVDPDYEAEKVLAAANDTLRDTFSFGKRQFGQPVNLSEVIALVQAVGGSRRGRHRQPRTRTGETVKLNAASRPNCLMAATPPR